MGVPDRRGWEIVEQYHDAGISGAKGRDKRPGVDQMLKDAQRRKFDVVMQGRYRHSARAEFQIFYFTPR